MIGLADSVDRWLGKPWVGLTIVGGLATLQTARGVDVANIAISWFTFSVLLILQSAARRDRMALHAKLDELITAVKGARNELAHVEEKTEQDIAALRQ